MKIWTSTPVHAPVQRRLASVICAHERNRLRRAGVLSSTLMREYARWADYIDSFVIDCRGIGENALDAGFMAGSGTGKRTEVSARQLTLFTAGHGFHLGVLGTAEIFLEVLHFITFRNDVKAFRCRLMLACSVPLRLLYFIYLPFSTHTFSPFPCRYISYAPAPMHCRGTPVDI